MFQKPLLSEFWRDFVSLSSGLLTIVGLIYAILQIRKTQSAAEAALIAARQAVDESRTSFERYVLANALRYFAEAQLYIHHSLWEKASLKLNDLAEQTTQLATDDNEWKELTSELRRWSEKLARVSSNRTRHSHRQWSRFASEVQSKIDERHGPFRVMKGGQGS